MPVINKEKEEPESLFGFLEPQPILTPEIRLRRHLQLFTILGCWIAIVLLCLLEGLR